jgi:hypothetical protein
MDRFHGMTNAVRVRLVGLAESLYGCSHRRTTFPMTLRTGLGQDGQQSTEVETYMACLECGRHFPYDWATMQVRNQRAGRLRKWSGFGRISERNVVPRGGRPLPEAVAAGLDRE